MGGREGARRQRACCLEQARQWGDRVSAQLYFWLDGLGAESDRHSCPERGTPPPRDTHSQKSSPGRLPSTNHPTDTAGRGESGFSPLARE